MNDVQIQVEGVWKRYNIHPVHSLMGMGRQAISWLGGRWQPREEFWALRDVSVEVRRGESLGVIGPNGAGKSTLLKILCGVTDQTRGEVRVAGRVAPLIELGAGFHPELSGRENVLINGVILGMSRREVRAKYDAIVEFSGLKDFMDTPVKKYSSGMFMRLAFSVAVHTDPDVLLVDEVLAVGDVEFGLRCYNWITEYRARGRTVVFVSHNELQIMKHCSRVMLLWGGQVRYLGPVDEALEHYHRELTERCGDLADRISHNGGRTTIGAVTLRDGNGVPCESVSTGEPLVVDIDYQTQVSLEGGYAGFRIENAAGITVLGATTVHTATPLPAEAGPRTIRLRLDEVPFLQGMYNITVFLNDAREHNVAYARRIVFFRVLGPRSDNRTLIGYSYVKHSWEILR